MARSFKNPSSNLRVEYDFNSQMFGKQKVWAEL